MDLKTETSLQTEINPSEPERLSRRQAVLRLGFTFVVSALGGYLAFLLQIPSPWLLGGMLAVSVSVAGLKAPFHIPTPVRSTAFVLVGMTMGTAADPSFLDAIQAWPVTLLGSVMSGLFITFCVALVLHMTFGWQKDAAFFASVPGALTAVLAAAAERGAQIAPIMTVQILRIYVLIIAAPILVDVLANPSASTLETSVNHAPLFEIAWVLVLSALGGLLAHRLKIPAGFLIGAFVVSLTVHVAGFASGIPPDSVLIPAYILIAAVIGMRIKQISMRDLPQLMLAASLAVIVGLIITFVFAYALSEWSGTDLAQMLLAYAPGALEIMIILSFTLGLDPTFVAIHQLVRFCAMAFMMSLIALFISRSNRI